MLKARLDFSIRFISPVRRVCEADAEVERSSKLAVPAARTPPQTPRFLEPAREFVTRELILLEAAMTTARPS